MSTSSVFSRSGARLVVTWLCTLWMTVMLVRALYYRGGPFFEIPETVFDRVQPEFQLSRQAIVMCRRAEPLMPRAASLTVINPENASNYDITLYLTASGLLPRHRVLQPNLNDGAPWPDFVIAVGKPFEHRAYRLLREFPEGRVYAAVR